MRYAPSQSELCTVPTLLPDERFAYFLQRVIESEDVWAMSEVQLDEESNLKVWPYREFVSLQEMGDRAASTPCSMSLEHFLYRTLSILAAEDVGVEVFPTAEQAGFVLNAGQLRAMLENLLEAGEYYLD